MRRLIINADDLGCNAQRSHGIFQCFEFGVVTSATIWPNGTDSDAAARHARERKLPVGIHLNLVEEYPLSRKEEVSSLVDMNGKFHSLNKLFEQLDAGAVKTEHLERELRAQLEWAFDQGLNLTHVASNYDAHVHPVIVNVLIPLMENYGLRLIRIPCEEPLPPFGYDVDQNQLDEIQRVNTLSHAARITFEAHGITSTDHFRGHTLLGNASLKNLRHNLARLPEGTTELMVHPGSMSAYGTPFDLDPQRQTELRMLLDPSIKDVLKERKIELISYSDL
jgi:chitin disaccharide deacetylase